jgi:serine/threonine protein kinase
MNVLFNSSSHFDLKINSIDIQKKDAECFFNYVKANKDSWDQQLTTNQQSSIFLRKRETGLPFSIQYWKDGAWVIHSKKLKDSGGNKKVLISADIINERLFARIKPLYSSPAGRENVISESKLIDSFSNINGIIQNYRSSEHLSKNDAKGMKFEILQELYEGTFDILEKISLSKEEIKMLMIDLMSGLAEIHERGLIHDDLKPKNILIQVDSNGKFMRAVLCDLGGTTDGKNFEPPFDKEKLKEAQGKEVDRLIGLFRGLHRSKNMDFPYFIDELSSIPDLPFIRDLGISPKPSVTAREALEALSLYDTHPID